MCVVVSVSGRGLKAFFLHVAFDDKNGGMVVGLQLTRCGGNVVCVCACAWFSVQCCVRVCFVLCALCEV